MELKVNQTYTTQEMIEFFGVSTATWKKKKDRLLDHFRRYYMYEVFYDTKDRRKINYKILKKLQEYEPPLGKGAKRDLVSDRKIEEVIEEDYEETEVEIQESNESDINEDQYHDENDYDEDDYDEDDYEYEEYDYDPKYDEDIDYDEYDKYYDEK